MKDIIKINKSFKYEGFLMVTTTDGREFKRRYRENNRGRFAGKITFNMFDNVYSFRKPYDWNTDSKSEVVRAHITFEGKYTDIYKGVSGKIKQECEDKNLQIPEVKAEEVEEEIIPTVEEIFEDDGPVKHEQYNTIKSCLECGIPIYLAGPAGSGKNFTVEQIANELGWNFYFSNSVQQEYKLTGFIDAGGNFHETEFSKACKEAADGNDVVFFLDEMDASIPEVLVLLNAAIANGYFEFPDGKINFNDKVHFVAAGNTVGSGADDMYTGRMVLDQATLDRFAIIEFDYSRRIELSLSDMNVDLVEFIHQMRDEAANKGIRATFSYRCITMVTKLEKSGMDLQMAMKIAVVKGLDKDTINTFNPNGCTKYHMALKNIQQAA